MALIRKPSSNAVSITTTNVAFFKLEFVQTDGVTWSLLARTIAFVDQLLEKELSKALLDSKLQYDDDIVFPNDVHIETVKSRTEEECSLQENMATHFCAKMKTTITSTEYSDHGTLNSQNFVDFLMTKALQNYMEDEEYPIVLQAIELTYLGPRWVSFDRLGLSLIGDISGKMNSANQRIFRRAVSAFINDDKQATLSGGATDVAIRHQTISHEDVYRKKKKMNTAPSELLYVEVTLFRTLEESKMTTKQYSDGLISRFESYPDYFVGHHLRTGFNDDFFLNVQTVQVAISEGNAIEIPVSTLSPSTKAPFIYTKPEKPFNLKALAASVAILPLIVLLAACVLIYLLSSRKRRRQRQSTKSSQQEVIIVE